ncbi:MULTISPECIES: 3'(2'),5'-bisphosphate nucleotidase CysQ [Deefgea]|uniref:3'(2'),5'-bisphosphate nucleotidase CysQ n=1 Tax=Deefgea chitinilytica TaxID=570276 RepID=A0ABS2C797_9NEIS|nr:MULTISPECIES: 3'(2'),5'-bisphosphate nucleotidase CysQ [Deefgea]MBM5570028.1 3'(2'),5'-bisphosphate nucleotidase CysQ [Deefgea chitinilytica]MBM9887257.1 3'(2'),5'-bisphosphate nucleotidase CysQ [Deefgea sp. CFH1-16]
MNNLELLNAVKNIAINTGSLILKHFDTRIAFKLKDDSSPVTLADLEAEQYIIDELKILTPNLPIISEEAATIYNSSSIKDCLFWLVDPIDGTKEFISGTGEFTVNIALIKNGDPIIGVVFAPALQQLFYAAKNQGAWLIESGVTKKIACRQTPNIGLTVVGSRSHGDATAMSYFLKNLTINEQISAGSSLKFCLIANGKADLYPRLGRTMEWDIAAAHAILNEAGGQIFTVDKKIMTYGKNNFENPHFVANNCKTATW